MAEPVDKNTSRVPEKAPAEPNAVSAASADSDEKRILLCVAGLSPQIVTETFYALATQKDFIPDEVHVITTTEGAQRIHLTLLEPDANEQHFRRLCEDLNVDPANILFDDSTIHFIPASPAGATPQTGTISAAWETPPDATALHLGDIRDVADNEAAADTITAIVKMLTADSKTIIHASIAGGRKTMGFYLGYAMSLFGREQDHLSHVLVSAPFESHPQFYYPPRKPIVLRDREQRPIHTRDAKITLADIPFVRLRGHLDNRILGEGISYSETVRRTQRNVDPPRLRLDPANRTIYCGEKRIAMKPNLFAFYAWFARRLQAGNPGIHWIEDKAKEEYLEEYACVAGEHGGRYDVAERSLKHGMTSDFFETKTAKLKKRLEYALGLEPARPYLPQNIGMKPKTRYRLKGLTMKREQVEFLKNRQP